MGYAPHRKTPGGPLGFSGIAQQYALAPRRVLTTAEIEEIKHTYAAMMRSQVALYPINLRGVPLEANLGAYQQEDAIAQATGGRAYHGNNFPSELLGDAVKQGASYYTLVYSPSNTNFDGSIRNIEVKLATKGNYSLSYRTLYYALSDSDAQTRNRKDPLREKFLDQKSQDSVFAFIELGAPIAHDLLFSAHLAKFGEPHMGGTEEMEQLRYSPRYFPMHLKDSGTPLRPVKVQTYVIDYGIIDWQLRAAVLRTGRPGILELAAAAYSDDGTFLSCVLNQGVASGDPRHPNPLFQGAQELAVPDGAEYIRLVVRDVQTDRVGALEIKLPPHAETAQDMSLQTPRSP